MISFQVKKVRIRDSVMMRTHRAGSARKVRKTLRVRAKRRLKGIWYVEPVQDLIAQHGIDLEGEIEAALTRRILNV